MSEYKNKNTAKSKEWKLRNFDKEREYRKKWKRNNRFKCKIHLATYRAIKRGQLKKEFECFICAEKTQYIKAHHPNYDYPLAVIWMCPSCHELIHRYDHCPSVKGILVR